VLQQAFGPTIETRLISVTKRWLSLAYKRSPVALLSKACPLSS